MKMVEIKIAPSLLSGDFSRLADESIRMQEYGADYLHMDIMDGHFVPNITIGPPVIQSLKASCPGVFLDCHLMVNDPLKWTDAFQKAGASLYMFHLESLNNSEAVFYLINKVKSLNMKVGIAIKPSTPPDDVIPYCHLLDMVLVMTVDPGFGGQKLIESCLEKVKILRAQFSHLNIEVDGGITLDNIHLAAKAGANVFVAGTSIFKSLSPQSVIQQMRQIATDNFCK